VRQVAVLSAALVAALVGSYVSWTAEETEVSDDAVPIYSAGEGDLTKVSWKGDEQVVVVERKTDAKGEYLWIDSTETKKAKKAPDVHPGAELDEDEGEVPDPEPVADPAADPAAPPEVKRAMFMSNSQGEDVWKSLTPLKAMRELASAGVDPATFGLAEPTATIEITRKSGAPITLKVGGETFGSKDRYVEHDGRVFLVDDATLRPLQFAAGRLIERSLFPLAEKETDRIDVHLGDGRTLAYVQQHKDDAAKAFWAKADAPEAEDESGATWIGKVFRLKLKEYVDESTVTAPLERVVSYDVTGEGETWKVEVLKTSTEPVQWYARSEYDRGLTTLTDSLARNVVDDLATLGTP
jgi:hypothetical protein